MTKVRDILVQIDAHSDPLISRTFTNLKERIEQRCPVRAVQAQCDAEILLDTSSHLPSEGYCIEQVGAAVKVSGGSPLGLLYGVGKFLRTSQYDGDFVPSKWRGTSVPQGSLRGMYFASHFHNWYHEAPEAEITRYVEDIALWGVNAIMICFPFINLKDWGDPRTEQAVAMAQKYARIAKNLGLYFCIVQGNTFFSGAPAEIRATPLPDPLHRRGNSGHPICPSDPDGHAYIMANARELFVRLQETGLDLIVHWPYDEGGCACAKCSPWGSNGYLKLSRDLTQLAHEYFPQLKTVLSTWMFDTPPEGEWQGLADALGKEHEDWVDYILADSHNEFPRYPLDVDVPGHKPLLNFPEISMWGNWPWGGSGALALPSRFERLWSQVKHVVQGGFPYSEGIYEDMNKAVVVQFYWDRDQSAHATLEEYAAYEFGPEVTEDVLAVIDILETVAAQSYLEQPVDAEQVREAHRLADKVHGRLSPWARENWRWEILHLRTQLDLERFAGEGLETPAAEAAMHRLIEIYHCQMETDDPYHHRVRPPLSGAISRCGEL